MTGPVDGSSDIPLNPCPDVAGRSFLVAGLGKAGYACADALLQAQAGSVLVVDRDESADMAERTEILTTFGAEVVVGPDAVTHWPDRPIDVLVSSPGWRPDAPLLLAADKRGIVVWSEIELAWRLRRLRLRPGSEPAPWLCVTGTNGKTTTVQMLASILHAAGLRTVAAGNVGFPLLQAVLDPEPYDVLAVELSSYQLHHTYSMQPKAAACLNLAPDHIDWHGSYANYVADKARIYHDCEIAAVYNEGDEATRRLVEEAEVIEGCRAIGFTTGIPGLSMLGIVDGLLVDRAFIADRRNSAAELGSVTDVVPPTPHNLENALAAAALARAYGVEPLAVKTGLAMFRPDAHRVADVGTVAGVRYIDDSKATNPHAANASLRAYDPVVWIAGGDAKGADFDDLVTDHRSRMRAAVLLGTDAGRIAQALDRHAPDVPVIRVEGVDDGVMHRVVTAAAEIAEPGDTVLLAPGCASWDMFANYGARGDAFAKAVHDLEQRG